MNLTRYKEHISFSEPKQIFFSILLTKALKQAMPMKEKKTLAKIVLRKFGLFWCFCFVSFSFFVCSSLSLRNLDPQRNGITMYGMLRRNDQWRSWWPGENDYFYTIISIKYNCSHKNIGKCYFSEWVSGSIINILCRHSSNDADGISWWYIKS